MPGIERPRHPERTVLYRVLFHHFERFVAEYESRFERNYGYFRPIVKDVVKAEAEVYRLEAGFPVVGMEDVAGGPISRQFSGS